MKHLTFVPPDNDPDSDPTIDMPTLTRRSLLTWAVSAPVVTVAAGFGLASTAAQAALALTPPDTTDYYDIGDAITQSSLPTMPLVRLSVGTDGRVKLELPRMEVGQGIDTAAGMMVAEELGVALSMVDVTLSDARPELMFNQLTGGSASVRALHAGLPLIAASMRARLSAAAAQQWGLPAASLSVSQGTVLSSDGRVASYGSLSAMASLQPMPSGVLPKSASDYKLVGTRVGRIDARAIVTGQKKFTLDQVVPDAMPTLVRRPPTILWRT